MLRVSLSVLISFDAFGIIVIFHTPFLTSFLTSLMHNIHPIFDDLIIKSKFLNMPYHLIQQAVSKLQLVIGPTNLSTCLIPRHIRSR